jgi:uncharacterized membrane protein
MSDTTATGLPQNVAGALSYVLGPITGIAFLILERENRFVRFHAAQSTLLGVAMIIVSVVLSIASGVLAFMPIIGWLFATLLSLVFMVVSFGLWLLLMFRAFQGDEWEFPIVGEQARKLFPTPAAG